MQFLGQCGFEGCTFDAGARAAGFRPKPRHDPAGCYTYEPAGVDCSAFGGQVDLSFDDLNISEPDVEVEHPTFGGNRSSELTCLCLLLGRICDQRANVGCDKYSMLLPIAPLHTLVVESHISRAQLSSYQ